MQAKSIMNTVHATYPLSFFYSLFGQRIIKRACLSGPKVLNGIAPTQADIDILIAPSKMKVFYRDMRDFVKSHELVFVTPRAPLPHSEIEANYDWINQLPTSDLLHPDREIAHNELHAMYGPITKPDAPFVFGFDPGHPDGDISVINGKQYLSIQRGKHRRTKVDPFEIYRDLADATRRAFDENGVALGGTLSDALKDMHAIEQKMPEVLDPAPKGLDIYALATRAKQISEKKANRYIDQSMPEVNDGGRGVITMLEDSDIVDSADNRAEMIFDSFSTVKEMTFERLHQEQANEIAGLDATVGRAEVIPFPTPKESNDE